MVNLVERSSRSGVDGSTAGDQCTCGQADAAERGGELVGTSGKHPNTSF